MYPQQPTQQMPQVPQMTPEQIAAMQNRFSDPGVQQGRMQPGQQPMPPAVPGAESRPGSAPANPLLQALMGSQHTSEDGQGFPPWVIQALQQREGTSPLMRSLQGQPSSYQQYP